MAVALAIAYNQPVEFLGPLIVNVAHHTDSHTINITYTAVASIEVRNQNGFQVYLLIYLIKNKIPCK